MLGVLGVLGSFPISFRIVLGEWIFGIRQGSEVVDDLQCGRFEGNARKWRRGGVSVLL
jgi:hypothetical protein